MSTYDAESSATGSIADPAVHRLSVAMWCWMAVVAIVCLLVWRAGADRQAVAAAAALALLPAVLTLLLLGRWGESWARTLALFSWIAFAAAAAAWSGGSGSPAVAAFLIAPALAAATGERERVIEATLFSALGSFAASSLFAAAQSRGAMAPAGLDVLPALLGALSVVFSGGLIAQALNEVPLAWANPLARPDTRASETNTESPRGPERLAQGVAGMLVAPSGQIRAAAPAALAELGLHGRAGVETGLLEAFGASLSQSDREALAALLRQAGQGQAGQILLSVHQITAPARTLALAARPAAEGLIGLTVADVSVIAARAEQAEDALAAAADASAAKSRHMGELSHELRTPLTHIIGFAELMERQVFGAMPERYAEYAGLIRTSGGHLLSLVNGMVDLARIEEGRHDLEIEAFRADDVAAEVVAQAQASAHLRNVSLNLEARGAPLPVRADARALRQMLVNTVGNAIKFTPENGAVRLVLEADGDELVLDTIDTGPGIPDDEKNVLGERFVRGSGSEGAPGSGLGLSLVRALAQLHGGSLGFHDAEGGGAIVRIRLPIMNYAQE